MPVPSISAVRLSGARNRQELPLLLLGPSLGSTVSEVWWPCVEHLADSFDLVAWDLPGHGHSRSVPDESCTMTELAAGVLTVVDDVLAQRDEVGGPFSYAGVGVGGSVGLQLLLDAPGRVRDAMILGLGSDDLDVRDRLDEVRARVLVVAGAGAPDSEQSMLRQVAEGITGARIEIMDDVTHPTPAAAPERVAALVRHLVLGEQLPLPGAAGAPELRRSVEELVEALEQGRWWEHPGLDPRTRLLVALTALVATGQHHALATHVELAHRLRLDDEEIRQLVLQASVHAASGDVAAARRMAEAALAALTPPD